MIELKSLLNTKMKSTLRSFYSGEIVCLNFDDASVNVGREDVRQLGGFLKVAIETHAKKNHDEVDLKGMGADSKLFLKGFEQFYLGIISEGKIYNYCTHFPVFF